MRFQPMLIDGNWVKASDGGEMEVINQATEEVFALVPKATNDDIEKAIASADRSFSFWAKLSPAQRAEYLYKASIIVMERYQEIGKTMTAEQGKPLLEAQGEVKKGADIHTLSHQLCHPPAGERLRYQDHPGAVGPRQCSDHHDLYPCGPQKQTRR